MSNPFRIIKLIFSARRPGSIDEMAVVCDSFWMKEGYSAMTFFGTIVAASPDDVEAMKLSGNSLKRHEMIHLRQAQATHDSRLLFYLLYGWYYLLALPQNKRMKNAAYYINPFELEAYAKQGDEQYLLSCRKNGAHLWREYAKMTPAERMAEFFPHFFK